MTSQDHRRPIYPHNSDQNSKDCIICFGDIVNKAFVNGCFHYFCYKCISMWIKHKANCPLCLRAIDSLITDVISADVYKIVRLDEVLQDQFKIPSPESSYSNVMTAMMTQDVVNIPDDDTFSTDSDEGHHGNNLDVTNEENENSEETEYHDDFEVIHDLSEEDSFVSDIEWEEVDEYEESADSEGHQENNLDEMTNEENENSEESENHYYEQDEGNEEDEPYELEVAYSSGLLEEDEYEEEFYNSYGLQYSSEEYEYVEPTSVEADHLGQSEYSDDDDDYNENGDGASQSESINDSSQYFDMEELAVYLSPSDDVSTDQLEEIMYGLDIQSSDGLSSDEQFEGDEQESDSDSNYSFIYDDEEIEYDTQDTPPESEYDEYTQDTPPESEYDEYTQDTPPESEYDEYNESTDYSFD